MPFGEYKDFAECVAKTMAKKKWSKERCSAYCATIERTINKRKKAKGENPIPGSPPSLGGKSK